jgi:NADH-quinone oxidoreductase subunit J
MAETYQQGVFWVLAGVAAIAAVRVVTAGNVIHAALYLVGTLMSLAGLYVLLFAEFVAWVQVLVYVGAIIVLMLFGLMLTRAPIGKGNFDNNQRPLAALCALAVFAVTSWVLVDAFEGKEIDFARGLSARGEVATSGDVGAEIFRSFVLPFEVISVLLLAALVGAVLIARKDR